MVGVKNSSNVAGFIVIFMQDEASVTSSNVYGMMLYDTQEKEKDTQLASDTAALDAHNKMSQMRSQEIDSKMSGNGNQNYRHGNQKLQLVEQTMAQILDLPLDSIDSRSTALRCQGMLLIQDMSQVEPSLWPKEKLLSACIASVFALPSVDTLQSQNGEDVDVQALYNKTLEAMESMLKGLLAERPNTTELATLLEALKREMTPWKQKRSYCMKRFWVPMTLLSLIKTSRMLFRNFCHISHHDRRQNFY